MPKGSWTEADFDKARTRPAFQDETSQILIEREYRRLRGLPQTFDPATEDPHDGMRGEGGASYWGDDPLENIPGGTEGLKQQPELRLMLQTLLLQVREKNQTIEAVVVLSALEALQQLKVCDLGAETRTLFPLREDEWQGPQFLNDQQRERAVVLLTTVLTDFLAPDFLPPADMHAPQPSIGPPDETPTLNDTPIQIHVPDACMARARSKGVLVLAQLTRAAWPAEEPSLLQDLLALLRTPGPPRALAGLEDLALTSRGWLRAGARGLAGRRAWGREGAVRVGKRIRVRLTKQDRLSREGDSSPEFKVLR